MSELKNQLNCDMKTAMKSGDKSQLGVIRLINAAIKQREVDERISLDDAQVVVILDKMVKQRRESMAQYAAAGREDLHRQEAFEVEVLQHYLPEALGEDEIEALIAEVIAAHGASSMKDMGKVMAQLRPQLQGRADMAVVSAKIKARLSGT